MMCGKLRKLSYLDYLSLLKNFFFIVMVFIKCMKRLVYIYIYIDDILF